MFASTMSDFDLDCIPDDDLDHVRDSNLDPLLDFLKNKYVRNRMFVRGLDGGRGQCSFFSTRTILQTFAI